VLQPASHNVATEQQHQAVGTNSLLASLKVVRLTVACSLSFAKIPIDGSTVRQVDANDGMGSNTVSAILFCFFCQSSRKAIVAVVAPF